MAVKIIAEPYSWAYWKLAVGTVVTCVCGACLVVIVRGCVLIGTFQLSANKPLFPYPPSFSLALCRSAVKRQFACSLHLCIQYTDFFFSLDVDVLLFSICCHNVAVVTDKPLLLFCYYCRCLRCYVCWWIKNEQILVNSKGFVECGLTIRVFGNHLSSNFWYMR